MSYFSSSAKRLIFLCLIVLSHGSPFSNSSPEQDNTRYNEPELTSVNKSVAVVGRGERDAQKRNPPCKESPPGVATPCTLCNGETTFPHMDDNGLSCECDACPPATILVKNCTCGDHGNETECKVLEKGEGYMDVTNTCDRAYPCTCPGDLIVTKMCTGAEDSKCDCPKLTDQTGPTTCTPIPLCSENHERQLVDKGGGYSVHVCVPCESGMVQPYHNSDQMCRKENEATDTPGDDITIQNDSSQPSSVDVDLSTPLPQDKTSDFTSALIEHQSTPSSQDRTTGKPWPPCTCPAQEDTIIHNQDNRSTNLVWTIVLVTLLPIVYITGRCRVMEKIYKRINDGQAGGNRANGEVGMPLNHIPTQSSAEMQQSCRNSRGDGR